MAAQDSKAGPKRYYVKAALAVGKTEDGKPEYVYRNGILPQSISAESIKHLLDTGLIAPVE